MTPFKNLSSEKQGEIYIYFEAILWGLFPVLSKLTFNSISPMFSLGLSLFLSLFYFFPAVAKKNKWAELKVKKAWLPIMLSTLICGIGFYILLYQGTALSHPSNVSILLLFEVFSTIVIFKLWGKESLSKRELIGSMLIVFAACIVLFPGSFQINKGDILIIIAVIVVPLGNYYNKIAMSYISADSILLVRNAISAILILLLASYLETSPNLLEIKQSAILLLINGVLILGYSKVLWLEGIHRLQISKAISISCLFPVITMLASYLLLANPPTVWQLAALVPAIGGVLLISSAR